MITTPVQQDNDLIIQSLICTPKSKNIYNYYINGTNEKHSMKQENLADFITELCPAVGGKARIMIYELRYFYVEIKAETITELEVAPNERESHRSIIFQNKKNPSLRQHSLLPLREVFAEPLRLLMRKKQFFTMRERQG